MNEAKKNNTSVFKAVHQKGIETNNTKGADRITADNHDIKSAGLRKANIIESKLQDSQRRLLASQRIAHIGSWEIDFVDPANLRSNRHIWSDETYRIFGFEPGETEVSFHMMNRLIPADDHCRARQSFYQALATRSRYDIEHKIIKKDGSLAMIHVMAEIVFDATNGKPLKIIGTTQDITAKKLEEQEKERITQELITRNKGLEQFAYITSHNVRGPLANILGMARLLNNYKLSSEDRQYTTSAIIVAAEKLDSVISDLNVILSLQDHTWENKQPVCLYGLVEEICSNLDHVIAELKVTFELDFTVVPEILSRKSYLYSIFYNLIFNGLKFHQPETAPHIQICSYKEDGKVVLLFRDNGIGINMERYGHEVFGLYKRFHKEIEGKGMGLFMTKIQVEALGGRITMESEPSQGTMFRIEFPINSD